MYRTLVGGDVMGSDHGGMSAYVWIFAFLIVFFVLLIFMWRRDGDRHHGGMNEVVSMILPLLMGKGKVGGGVDECVLEEERSTRRVMHDIDLQTGRICKDIEQVRVEQKELALCAEKEKCAQLRADLSDERQKNYIGAAFGKLSHELDGIKSRLPSVVKSFSKPEFGEWLGATCGEK